MRTNVRSPAIPINLAPLFDSFAQNANVIPNSMK